MRNKLKAMTSAERHTFVATVGRYGWKNGWKGPIRTILLKNVITNGEVVCDHLWFTMSKGFENARLMEGDVIQFKARVGTYLKGYKGWRNDVFDKPIERDWKLQYPTDIKKVKNEPSLFEERPPHVGDDDYGTQTMQYALEGMGFKTSNKG